MRSSVLVAACLSLLACTRPGDPCDDSNGDGTCDVCDSCGPAPAHGQGACATSCEFVCDPGYVVCGSGCCLVKAVAAGGKHTCVLTDAGGVKCWGSNQYGQLGTGALPPDLDEATAPLDVAGLTTGVKALVAGQNHTCAVTDALGVKCWGRNNSGQLGRGGTPGTPSQDATPLDVAGLGTVASMVSRPMAAGSEHNCAIGSTGGVKCWGLGGNGQLGNGANATVADPVAVTSLSGSVVQVDAGGGHTCAVVAGGTVQCWGQNASGELGKAVGGTFNKAQPAVAGLSGAASEVALGYAHTCIRISGGAVQCFGLGTAGQIGNGLGTSTATPAAVSGVTGATAIAAGYAHACAAVAGGALKCWGRDAYGELGDSKYGDLQQSNAPVDVPGIAGTSALLAGDDHSCALTSGGLYCWGLNDRGQVGDGSSDVRKSPAPVRGLVAKRVAGAVAAGLDQTCALDDSGGVVCFGRNEWGQLGSGLTLDAVSPGAVTPALTGASSVAASGDALDVTTTPPSHSCAVDGVGAARCWGRNNVGQLGDGTYSDRTAVTQVSGLTSGVTAIRGGATHTCAVASGAATCWGANASGQLGNNSTATSNLPVAVQGLTSGVTEIAAGYRHSCAVANGGVRCWGLNQAGQLGNASIQSSPVPVAAIADGAGTSSLAAGSRHTCAVAGGVVSCWGDNGAYQLGIGADTSPKSSPTTVLESASRVAAGDKHSCAVTAGGVKCWGTNSNGQLGDGSKITRTAPTDVLGLGAGSGAIDVATGANHSCALLASGRVLCWGYNRYGQLGDGGAGIRPAPVKVLSGSGS